MWLIFHSDLFKTKIYLSLHCKLQIIKLKSKDYSESSQNADVRVKQLKIFKLYQKDKWTEENYFWDKLNIKVEATY